MEATGVTSPALKDGSEAKQRAQPLVLRVGLFLVLLLVAVGSAWYGLKVRRDLWEWTSRVHFSGDVANGFRWGWNAKRLGLFHVYDDVARGDMISSISPLDYTPLRLAAVTWWVHWAESEPKFDHPRAWQDTYDMTWPMLWGNTISELASSVLVFLLIRMWIVRMKGPGFFRGVVPGLFGALLFWFNPAVLWDGHAWPQWDVWLVPWFLGAVLLSCFDWWFAAGICLAIGGSLKGQLLLGAPVLLLWPLFQWRINALFRMIAGILSGTATIAFPWLLLSKAGFTWFALVICAMGLTAPFLLRWRLNWPLMAGILAAAMLLAWPWASPAPVTTKLYCLGLVALVGLARFFSPRLVPHGYALAIAGAAFLTIPVFNASSTWFTRGFLFGTERYGTMISGNGTYNLPALLETYFRWPGSNDAPAYLPFVDKPITFRQQMSIIYGICLAMCGIGAAIQSRRRDTRFLVAMVAPWVIMYCLLPQMMGRYLIWGAAMSALLAGAGVGLALLGVFISLIAVNGMIENQNVFYNLREIIPDDVKREMFAVRPHLGWALLLGAAILLYYAFLPRTKATLM